MINQLLLKEQSGFLHKKSVVDRIVLRTQNIGDCFLKAKKKEGLCRVYKSDRNKQHCLALRPHFPVAEANAY